MNVNIVKRLAVLFLIALVALPSHGRFISEDKWEGQQDVAPSLHKYLYTYQNPTVYVDPDGNAPVLAEMTNGLMSQVDYINNRATAYRKQGGLSGHFTATMMNVGAGVHAILGGAVGLANTIADVGISGSASRLEGYGVEFNEYGVVADSRAHLSDVGTSLKRTGNTIASFHDRNVRSELGRGLVETGVGVINGDADALNKFATTSATFGAGGALSKLNPARLGSSTPSNYGPNVSIVTENPSGITPRIHRNGQANSAQYAKLKDYYANQDTGYVPLSNKKLAGNNDPRNYSLANSTHPVTGVRFTPDGYPDFEPHAVKTIQIKQTGNNDIDFKNANIEAGLGQGTRSHAKELPGNTWHHHQNGVDMQLIKTDPTHGKTGHSGGAEIEKRAGGAKRDDEG